MSIEGFLLDEDDTHESKSGPSSPPIQFQFIDLSVRSQGHQAQNRKIARSHVTKHVRRTQGKKQREARPRRQTTEDQEQIRTMIDQFFHHSTWVPNSACLSEKRAIESTFSALQTYKGRVTPYLHELLAPFGKSVWNGYWPPENDELSPLFFDWFSYISSYPAMFHVACYVAATFFDLTRGSLFYSLTPEIQMHKLEAIRLINKELEKGRDVPEIILYAIMSLIADASEIMKRMSEKVPQAEVLPFKPPFVLMDWKRISEGISAEEAHIAGSKIIVRMKGGIEQLQERFVAFTVSYVHLLDASFKVLKPPEIGFYALPEALRRVADPARNVLSHLISPSHVGSGFANLLTHGLTQDALAVLMEMSHFSILIETHLHGRLINPDEWALRCKRDQLHHKVLSLPRGDTERTSVYECCRWAAVLFSSSLLFPMPRSTGTPQTLIKEIRKCIDKTSLTILVGEIPRPFFIWVLMLGGIAAEGLPERPWFEEMLNHLFVLEGTSRWSEVKEIMESFLWMESCCDSGAMNLWDNVAASLRETRQKDMTEKRRSKITLEE